MAVVNVIDSKKVLFIAIFLAIYGLLCDANVPHRKFEYKYSFKPPYLAQSDKSVPFWVYGGNAIASAENVRLAPSLRSQKGAMWTAMPITFDWWEVEIVFRVTGRGRIGADGLAFWYTSAQGAYDGEVYGSSDKWNGLGVFFDSFDNDNKHNNPYIMAVVNDGTKNFDHQNDGMTQASAGCLRDFRNKPYPTRAKIEYYQNTLTLLFHNGMTNNDQDYDICFRVENIFLPKSGYFGISAATGGLADDHDVLHFLTNSLYQPSANQGLQGQMDAEQMKLSQEYQEYQRKLQEQKDEYKREHPEMKTTKDEELGEWYETDNQRELRQIFQGQSSMFEALRELHRKLDEVIGRQERSLSLLAAVQQGAVQRAPVPAQPGQPGQPPVYIDTITRPEVDAVLGNQNLILNTAREIKNFVTEVKVKSDQIITNQARQPTAQVQSVGYDMQSVINEINNGLNHLTQAAQRLGTNPAAQTKTDCASSCISVTVFLTIAAVQLFSILGYLIYKDSKESQAKKFY